MENIWINAVLTLITLLTAAWYIVNVRRANLVMDGLIKVTQKSGPEINSYIHFRTMQHSSVFSLCLATILLIWF